MMTDPKIFEHLSAESLVLSLTPAEMSDWADAVSDKTGMGFNAALEAISNAASIFDAFLTIRARRAEQSADTPKTPDASPAEPKRQLVFCRYEAFEQAGRIVDRQMEPLRQLMAGYTGVIPPRDPAIGATRSDALERLDKTHYKALRRQSSPRGYICGNLPVDALVDVVEEYRSYLQGTCPDCANAFETDGHAFGCSFADERPGNPA